MSFIPVSTRAANDILDFQQAIDVNLHALGLFFLQKTVTIRLRRQASSTDKPQEAHVYPPGPLITVLHIPLRLVFNGRIRYVPTRDKKAFFEVYALLAIEQI